MSLGFEKVLGKIYRLKIPFTSVYTSVFLIEAPSRLILVDCASAKEDVDQYIVPALSAMGYRPKDVDFLVLTHSHGDHAGGLSRVQELAPHLTVVRKIRPLAEGICTYPMPGHTKDCIGVLDENSHSLICGDGLQGAGVDRYRCSLSDPEAYRQTLRAIGQDQRIENLLFSHAYEPWYQDVITERENLCACLRTCEEYL